MTKKKEDDKLIDFRELSRDAIKKVFIISVIFIFGGVTKATWDVYSYSKTGGETFKLAKSNHKALSDKVGSKEFHNLERKVDKILVGLCMINKKTCRLQD